MRRGRSGPAKGAATHGRACHGADSARGGRHGFGQKKARRRPSVHAGRGGCSVTIEDRVIRIVRPNPFESSQRPVNEQTIFLKADSVARRRWFHPIFQEFLIRNPL